MALSHTTLTLKQLQMLQTGDAKALEDYAKEIKAGTLAATMQKMPVRIKQLYRLTDKEGDPEFKKFCEQNKDIQSHWEYRLVYLNQPNFPLTPLEKEVPVPSLFARMKSALFLSEYNKYPEPKDSKEAKELLDAACECYSFQALETRLLKMCDQVTEMQADESTLKKIFTDAALMGKLYWSSGYLAAADALIEIATALYKVSSAMIYPNSWSWQDKYDSPNLPDYIKILQVAMEYFFIAEKLAEREMSVQITQHFFPAGLLKRYEGTVQDWQHWDSLHNHHINMLNEDPNDKGFAFPQNAQAFCRIAEQRAEKTVAGFKLPAVKQQHDDKLNPQK